jgi:hypothetical protein
MEDSDHFQRLCHRVGELLATAGIMDAHLRTTNNDAPPEVLDNWGDKLDDVISGMETQCEEMMAFAEFFDTE